MYNHTIEEMSARLDYIKEIKVYIKHLEKLPPADQLKVLKLVLDRDEHEYSEITDKLLTFMERHNDNQ